MFKLQPARRIIYGAVLCFLAALLAVEAKMAWTANAGHSPTDITCVKLCPVPGKSINPGIHAIGRYTDIPVLSTALVVISMSLAVAKPAPSRVSKPEGLQRTGNLSYFSPHLFLRPPPAC